IQTVAETLRGHQITELCFTREPGGTPIAESLRQLLKTKQQESIPAISELLLLYAARVQLVENVIVPALQQGQWVIGDRHDLSTQAYQGGGRQLSPTLIQQIKTLALGNFEPDFTLYLDIEPQLGLQRAAQRGQLDRFEQEALPFFQRIRQRYLQLAQHQP